MMCGKEYSGYIRLGKMAVSKEQKCVVELETSHNWGDKCRFLNYVGYLYYVGRVAWSV